MPASGIGPQQGSPQELFERPVNQFVAGFIGSPSKNFMVGVLTNDNGQIWVSGDGYRLPLSQEASRRLEKQHAGDVVVGLRPSAFAMGKAGAATIDLRIVVAEYLGNNSMLATRCGASDLLVETPSATLPKAGETISFGLNAADILIFDRASGKTL